MFAVGLLVWWASSAFNWLELLVLAVIAGAAVLGLSLAFVAGRADREIRRQYDELQDHPDEPVVYDWFAEDTSTVRHGGLGR